MMLASDYEAYEHWKRWSREAFGTVVRGDAKYFESELTKSGVPSLRGLRLLELGFGNGAFATWAIDRGATYSGTEAIPLLVALGRERGMDVHVVDEKLAALVERESVDVVVAIDVLEHIEVARIRELLDEVFSVLKPGGRLVARMPSGDSPFARAIQYGDLTHRTVLGSSAVRQLAMRSGLSVEQLREPAFPLTGFGAVAFLRRCAVRLTRAFVYAICARILVGEKSLVMSPNMMLVLRKPTAPR